MNDESVLPPPSHARWICAVLVGAAAVGLLLNHLMVEVHGVARLMILCVGPPALFLGIGGLIEPKVFWAVGKHGRDVPMVYKVIGGVLGGLGVVVVFLLLLFVYRLGPPRPIAARPARMATRLLPKASVTPPAPPAPPALPERSIVPQEIMCLTYDRPNKRWIEMDEKALQGVRREESDGTTTLHYVEGTHALLKVLWPDVLEPGERFLVEVQGANSVELIDLAGDDANARIAPPPDDAFVSVEIHREPDKLTFRCDGMPVRTWYASGKLRGDEARDALVAASLRPGFSLKRGEQVRFRNARLVQP